MSKKKFVFTITVVIFLISALSVFSIVKDFANPDSGIVRTERDSVSKPSKLKLSSGCSAQSGTCPPAWNIEDNKTNNKIDNKEF